jgi:hypothetical protein
LGTAGAQPAESKQSSRLKSTYLGTIAAIPKLILAGMQMLNRNQQQINRLAAEGRKTDQRLKAPRSHRRRVCNRPSTANERLHLTNATWISNSV